MYISISLHSPQAIQMFRELRSEVALMAKLRHPCIVTLIATSVKPPCFLLELAPMGSLQSVLENELKEKGFKDSLTRYRTKDTTQPSVLSKMLTYKLVLQVCVHHSQVDCHFRTYLPRPHFPRARVSCRDILVCCFLRYPLSMPHS